MILAIQINVLNLLYLWMSHVDENMHENDMQMRLCNPLPGISKGMFAQVPVYTWFYKSDNFCA